MNWPRLCENLIYQNFLLFEISPAKFLNVGVCFLLFCFDVEISRI